VTGSLQIDVETHRDLHGAVSALQGRIVRLTPRTRFEFVTSRSITGVVRDDRVRLWPIGPSGGEYGAWHHWRPVFDGRWSESSSSVHLVGQIALNRAVRVNIAIAAVVLGAWLFAGAQASVLSIVRDRTFDALLLLVGIGMPVLFAAVVAGIFWTSLQEFEADRAALRVFIEQAFDLPTDREA
jgi:hypothetical protein